MLGGLIIYAGVSTAFSGARRCSGLSVSPISRQLYPLLEYRLFVPFFYVRRPWVLQLVQRAAS